MKRNSFSLEFILVLSFLLLLGSALTTPAQDNTAGNPTPPADADDVREQMAVAKRLLPQVPDRGAVLYFLSTSEAHLGETREALRLLKECLSLHEGFDPAGSPNLKALRGTPEFDDLVASVHREFPVVENARLALTTVEKDLMPEGLAYDSQRNVFYMSSLNRRKIVQIAANGKVSDFVPADRDHLLDTLGIRMDPRDATVWANSLSESEGRGELLHFDSAGNLLGRFSIKNADRHGFNDLVVRKSGEVILTDTESNRVYRFDPTAHKFARLPIHRTLCEPNGIALADDDRQLFVADDFGVVRVDLESRVSADINPGPRSTLAGIDGLYWHNGALIAVQNGIGSPRVAAFRLSKGGTRVTETTVLENRSALMSLPTTGAIRGDDFYFILNSQADNFAADRAVDAQKLEAVRIGVLHLP